MEAKVTKVSKTESHEGSQKGEFTVCEGKLILIEITREERRTTASHSVFFSEINKCYKPIIISETEVIENNDYGFDAISGSIFKCNVNTLTSAGFKKVLALPENFSPKQMMAIIDEKLKDGDNVLVECEKEYSQICSMDGKTCNCRGDSDKCETAIIETILLTDNHIKLFPAKMLDKTYSGEELEQIVFDAMKYAHGMGISKDGVGGREGVKKWIKKYQDEKK